MSAPMTHADWKRQEDRDAVEDEERNEADHRFQEDAPPADDEAT